MIRHERVHSAGGRVLERVVAVLRYPRTLPPVAADTALTALAAVYAVTNLLRGGRGHGPASPWAIGLALLATSALLLRGRWPVLALAAAGLVGAALMLTTGRPTFVILPTVFIALYSAVAYSALPKRAVWAVALAVCIGLNLITAITPEHGPPLLPVFGDDGGPPPGVERLPPPAFARERGFSEKASTLLFDSAWMLTALVLGEAMRGRRVIAHEAELRAVQAERARQEAEHAQHELAARRLAEERLQIARELHDVLAHTVALINVQAGVAAHVIDKQPEQAREALNTIKSASRESLQELRALVGVLRETGDAEPRAPTPGLAGLDHLVASVRDAGLDVEMAVDQPPPPVPATVDVAAYRILQEALTNVIKHAGPSRVSVAVHHDGAALTLDVTNARPERAMPVNGTGMGHGIMGMRERAAALGGRVQAGPLPDGRFQVHAVLPLAGGSA